MYPIQRNRRLRSSASLRALVQEFSLSPNDFIVPLFVIEGNQTKEGLLDFFSADNYKESNILEEDFEVYV